jgi:hypothetical protein
MRRPVFGILVTDRQGNALVSSAPPGGGGTVWTAKTGGTQIVDLVDDNRSGATDGFVSTDAFGELAFHYPNDGTAEAWVDFGFGRFFVQSSDASDRIAALEAAIATMLTSGMFGVATTGVPGPLDASSLVPATQIPTGVGGFASLGAGGVVSESEIGGEFPAYIQYPSGGPWPLRSTATASATRMVIWKGPTDPTFGAGYAIGGVDVWFQET